MSDGTPVILTEIFLGSSQSFQEKFWDNALIPDDSGRAV
jgi:hypothetical protein